MIMSRRIVFATGNPHKIEEIRAILGDLADDIVTMKQAGVTADIIEDGETFEENALIKAQAVAAYCPEDIVMADDSGLEVDYLGKEPGIRSSRFMGEDTPYEIKNAEIIRLLEGVPKEKRTARFVCAAAAVVPGCEPIVVRGTIEGYIGWEPAGENGFGYDPIFYVHDLDCSTAQMSPEEKNARSHRGNAMRMIRTRLEEVLEIS